MMVRGCTDVIVMINVLGVFIGLFVEVSHEFDVVYARRSVLLFFCR